MQKVRYYSLLTFILLTTARCTADFSDLSDFPDGGYFPTHIDNKPDTESDSDTEHDTEAATNSETDRPIPDTDNCPNDPDKIEPGVCGCGIPDTDGDNDGTPDCNDDCPKDPQKIVPGKCGCGATESSCVCKDNPLFKDAQGYYCYEWEGYNCKKAQEEWGYTAAQETKIIENCAKSCGLC